MKLLQTLFATVALLTLGIGAASATSTITVPGTSNPFLAGASGAESVSNGDTDPFSIDAPPSINVTPGQTFSVISVTGTVSNGPCCAAIGPNGGAPIGSAASTANGFTELVSPYSSLPINSLIGVFYGPVPGPGVDTVFEIGGGPISFVVPNGATKLFLATVDGFQWNNNTGAFDVTYSLSAAPEPATWIALLVGFGMLGFAVRGSRRNGAVAAA